MRFHCNSFPKYNFIRMMCLGFSKHFSVHFIIFSAWLVHGGSTLETERSTFIIHMDMSLMPMVFTSYHHWYSSIIDSLKASITPTESDNSYYAPNLLYTYENVMHGFSAFLSEEELEKIKDTSGFVSAYIDKVVTVDTTYTTQSLSLNPSTGLWPTAHFGQDMIIGIVDTGIWPESQSFKDDGMSKIPARWKGKCEEGEQFNSSLCNKKLIGARSFNKAVVAHNPHAKITLNSPRDLLGHGTHTASTAAGNYVEDVSFFGYAKGTAKGVAPLARLAMYKVVWSEGSYTSDVIAGMDQAIADGVDVISVSLGYYGVDPFYENPIAIASFGAMEKGVLVCASAGNDGPRIATMHNDMPWGLTVAASTVDRSFAGTLILGNGLTINGWTMFPASALVDDFPLVYDETLAPCNDTVLLPRSPYAIIICNDIGRILEQLEHVSRSNSAGAVMISDDPVLFEKGDVSWPVVVISPTEAEAVIHYAKTDKNPTASLKFSRTILGQKPAPAVALYSSRGPSKNCPGILKPDVMAPGSLVLAAFTPNGAAGLIGAGIQLWSHYTMMSGTSMSCPHVAGVVAMLKSAHPDWSPTAIRSALMTTANPLDNTNTPIKDHGQKMRTASPIDMGAGQINPNQALDPGLVYDATPQDYVNLLCSMNYTSKQILTITRSHNSYNCSNPNSDLNYPAFVVLYGNKTTSKVQTFKRSVTNVGDNEGASYKAKITAIKGCAVTVSPETLVFTKKNERLDFSVIIRCMNVNNGNVTFGWLSWVQDNGKHTVTSPIVVLD